MTSNPPTSSLPESASRDTRCGYVALVGRPNAGKSTLFNALVGARLSIVTPRPQTTRNRILGILTRPNSQIVFLDTPGLLEPSYRLHESMERQIAQAARQSDLALLLLDAERPLDRSPLVHKFLGAVPIPVLAVLNKADLLDEGRLQAERQALMDEFRLPELLPISALHHQHLDLLLERLEPHLPFGPKLYPDDMIAEQPERFFAAEFVREAAFSQLEEELPYSIEVAVEQFRERQGQGGKTYISAILYVERESQKGIVIGRRGSRLRAIGQQARKSIEDFLEEPVFLELRVKVRPGWRDRDRDLKEFGYL